jgi:hypothetical protein
MKARDDEATGSTIEEVSFSRQTLLGLPKRQTSYGIMSDAGVV